jgi:mannose-6-phosphate isomerase-like protein (cupin superfamily)
MPVTDRGRAEHYTWGENCDGWHLLKSDAVSVIQEFMPPQTQEARHCHAASRQFFFILSGEATIEVDGTTHSLMGHQGLEIPPGVPHQVMNSSDEGLEFLVISVPPSHQDKFPA